MSAAPGMRLIDRVNAAALPILSKLVADWFPHGERFGDEWRCGSIRGEPGASFSVNMRTGKFKDFASENVRGNDPVSLFAAHKGILSQIEAALALGRELDIDPGDHFDKASQAGQAGFKTPQTTTETAGSDRRAGVWVPMVPPPDGTPTPPNPRKGFDHLYEYRGARGDLLFYVRRREARSGESKLFTPLTFGTLDGKDGWHAKAPAEPRPLFGLNLLASRHDATVIVCEGEKAAIAAAHRFPDHVCMTWPNGASAVGKADWTPLSGREVIIWPDADAAGQKAATAILERLPRAHILWVNDLPEGHDAADDLPGFDSHNPQAWLTERMRVEASAVSGPKEALKEVASDWEWRGDLQQNAKGQARCNLANVLCALRRAPHLIGLVARDEMIRTTMLLRPVPIRPAPSSGLDAAFGPRPIRDDDVTGIQEWLQQVGLPSIEIVDGDVTLARVLETLDVVAHVGPVLAPGAIQRVTHSLDFAANRENSPFQRSRAPEH